MDYPLTESNPICRVVGHWFGPSYVPGRWETVRGGFQQARGVGPGTWCTCRLCGYTRREPVAEVEVTDNAR